MDLRSLILSNAIILSLTELGNIEEWSEGNHVYTVGGDEAPEHSIFLTFSEGALEKNHLTHPRSSSSGVSY